METSAGTLKKITLELGGNDPAVFVHESQYEEYVQRFAEETKRLKMGSGFEKATTHAPINNKMQIDRVEMLVNEAKAQGARIVTGGKRFQPTDQPDGYYFEPTILA